MWQRFVRFLDVLGVVTIRDGVTKWPLFVAPFWVWQLHLLHGPRTQVFRTKPGTARFVRGRVLPWRWGFAVLGLEVGDRGSSGRPSERFELPCDKGRVVSLFEWSLRVLCQNTAYKATTLVRYYLFMCNWFSVALHKFVRDDEPCSFHNHPFNFRSFFWGSRAEEKLGEKIRLRWFTLSGGKAFHRVEGTRGRWTLVVMGPQVREWERVEVAGPGKPMGTFGLCRWCAKEYEHTEGGSGIYCQRCKA